MQAGLLIEGGLAQILAAHQEIRCLSVEVTIPRAAASKLGISSMKVVREGLARRSTRAR